MSHFLLKKDDWREETFEPPWAVVTVELVEREVLKIQPGSLGISKRGTTWTMLPKRMKVIGCDGEVIQPSRGRFFWVSTATFNPFHLLMEAGEYGPDTER